MKEYSLIEAGVEHLQMIHDMAEIAFRDTYADILSQAQMDYMMDWMYSIPNLRSQLADGHVYHIAFCGDKPCGYVSVQPEGMDGGVMVWHLQKLYVLPSEKGNGLGRILFEKAVSYASKKSSPTPCRIELNVNRNNPSVSFYRHLGMKVLRQGDFPIENGFYMNDYIMGLDVTAQEP